MMRSVLRLFPARSTRMEWPQTLTARATICLEDIESYVTSAGFENQRIQKGAAMQTGMLEVGPGNSVNPQSKRSLRHKDKI